MGASRFGYTKLVSARLAPDQMQFVESLGGGQPSLGIRLLIERAMLQQPFQLTAADHLRMALQLIEPTP
jgi:hypothetical protein